MSFTDTLKRSLGFEETESKDKKDGEGFNINEFINRQEDWQIIGTRHFLIHTKTK